MRNYFSYNIDFTELSDWKEGTLTVVECPDATDWFLKYLRQINSEVESDEKKLRKSITNAYLIQLRDLQKTLVYFNTSIRGNQVMTDRLSSLYQEKELLDVDLLEDLVIELKQAFNTVSVYTEILNATMDSYASIISNNLNVIMKRMTSFSIALMIPTLVASFYGMNVINHAENSYQREFGIRNTLRKLNRQLEKSCRFFW